MASEDVIELGSSDDEAEPAPKKKKPMPNAMVHIPSKLPGVTIKPAKPNLSLTNKGVLIKPNVVNKSFVKLNPTVGRIKLNSSTIRMPNNSKNSLKEMGNAHLLQHKVSINPLSIAKSLSKSQVVLKKVPPNKKLRNPIEIQGPKVLNNLPPGITVKPVLSTDITIKPVYRAGVSGVKKSRLVAAKKKPPGELLTVEIDDEDATDAATASPQWYLRPEEQVQKVKGQHECNNMDVDKLESSMEDKNNKEPDTKKYVEITIEDSPLKSVHSNHPDIGKELTITIEDSPVKPITKITKEVESDSEVNEIIALKSPQSKKKLDYPNKHNEANKVEIEIDYKVSDSINESENKNKPDFSKEEVNEDSEKSSKQTRDVDKVIHTTKETIAEFVETKENNIDDGEFHPVYQKFIDMCFQLENTEDMKKIVEKKIKAYYRQCPKDYVESEQFIDMVSSKIVSMKAAPEKMYLYIKDIVDELNLQRKMTKSIVSNKVDIEKESSTSKYEQSPYDSKKRRQIRKLEKTIKKLHRAIQKLEEQEVDFDDDEDSVYLLTERYKERMVRVHAKFCQLTNTKMPSEPRIHIEARPGRPTGPAKKLEKWINRKVPMGTPLPFPDFHDVLRCVKDANEEEKLGWNDIDIMEEARDLFTRCGKKLQRRRQENEWRIAASRISVDVDPAEDSLELKQKLDVNKTVATTKETELLNKYVDRQNQLKLEAEEIGDKEAEESPVESEEEEEVGETDNSLEDKQKRKQRLKRLIKEKSKKDEEKESNVKKASDEKENLIETIQEGSKDKDADGTDKECIETKSSDMVIDAMPNEAEVTEEKETESDSVKNQKENENNDNDSNKVESDIDELHLLQKLHSENEANTSTLETSDSDTPIAISDTFESDSEVENGVKSCDVISIENSSYSEMESTVDGLSKDNDTISLNKQNVEELVNANFEVEYSSTGFEESKEVTANAESIVEEVEENILLASSDEDDKDTDQNVEMEDTCINLRDDSISISETTVDGVPVYEGNISNDDNSMQENNNAVLTIEGSPESEETNSTINKLQEDFKDDHINCEESIQDTKSSKEPTNHENLATDIVDTISTKGISSIESTELQTNIENKDEVKSEHTKSMDYPESHNNEITEDLPDTNQQNNVHVTDNEINDITATESRCDERMDI